eukprot:4007431-Pleurochrysis_carterae.AAC.4
MKVRIPSTMSKQVMMLHCALSDDLVCSANIRIRLLSKFIEPSALSTSYASACTNRKQAGVRKISHLEHLHAAARAPNAGARIASAERITVCNHTNRAPCIALCMHTDIA